MMKIST